jgi:hypothetical protein
MILMKWKNNTKMYVVVIFLLLGCGCRPSNPYGAVMVNGTVTLDGKAIEGVSVIFSPDSTTGMSAGGMTDAKGNFVLTTGGAPFGTGAVPGIYHVALSKVSNEGQGQQLTVDEFNEQLQSGLPAQRSRPADRVVHLVPEKYSNAKTSGLQPVTVEQKGKNIFNFEMKTD